MSKHPRLLALRALLVIGAGVAACSLGAAPPAAAQVACPYGYYYAYGYGCVPAAPGYGDVYGAPGYYGYVAPPYDSFGLTFGFGGRRGFRGGGPRGGGGFHGGGGGHGGGRR